jgi:hypothetical protein
MRVRAHILGNNPRISFAESIRDSSAHVLLEQLRVSKHLHEARRLIYEENRYTEQAHARTCKHQEVRQQKGSNQ